MPDKDKKFHEFALKSVLFKGRHDWYYCYLKAEKIAHALSFLSDKINSRKAPEFEEIMRAAGALPSSVVHFAAGEIGLEVLLADIFILLSNIRLCATNGLLNKENSTIFIQAYEELAEKMTRSSHVSPFVSPDDLLVPPLPLEDAAALPPASFKGHTQSAIKSKIYKGQSERTQTIIDYIKRHKKASIKELSLIITDCSEKTIQRELGILIAQGLVRKEGERRWSVYFIV
jgi:hypothetical protein